MRELKFRAWDNIDKEFAQNITCLLDISVAERVFTIDDESGEVIIEQYTGLKDKNGKEIYEGDILWWEHFYGMTGENKEYTEKVYWEEKDAGYAVGDWFEPLGSLVYEDAVEVIGNIHENPELLK